MKKLPIYCLILISLFASCKDPNDKPTDGEEEEVTVLPNHEIIYEINVRNFSSNGNFAGVTAAIPRLKQLGIDILWLMPIHPIGEQHRTGSKGSPYSVKDYLAINPDYGNEADLHTLVNAAHENGMKIIIDWVANHTAWDNVWVSQHLDYYTTINGQCPAVPAGTNWSDVVDLDYNNANMRLAMINAMQYWVSEFNIDGFRCDYVTGVPVNFWEQARTVIDPSKQLFWLAEGESSSFMGVFNCDYAWAFSDNLNAFGQSGNVLNLKSAITTLFNNTNYTAKNKMVYISNHDVNFTDGTEFTRFQANVFNMTILFFTCYDMPLLYNGQEVGFNKQMSLFDVDRINWNLTNPAMTTLVKKMIALKHSQPALENGAGRGDLTFYPTDNSKILAYTRSKGANSVLIILNLANTAQSFNFTGTCPQGEYANWQSTGKQSFSIGTTLSLPANANLVLVQN
jgi:glycosidase